MAEKHAQVFVLSLGERQSIGPNELRAIWAVACQSLNVSVTKRPVGAQNLRNGPSYGLWAGRDFSRQPTERRLRAELEQRGFNFTLTFLVQ